MPPGLDNRIHIYRDYIRRQSALKGLPVEIGIELTNHCNLACPFCAREEMIRTEGSMPLELFYKIVDEIKDYAEMIYLHGDGEPMIHKGLFDAVRYAKKNGLRVGMSTNATLLDERRSLDLIDSGLDYLILAIDGATKETYEKIRVKGKYEVVKAHVERFLQLCREKESPLYSLVQIIEMAENQHEIENFKKQWRRFKPNVVRVKRLTDLVWKEKIAHYSAPCFYIWRSVMIDWDGTVFPCCVDTNSEYRLGNLKETTLANCWNGPVMQQLRKHHLDGEQNKVSICRTCDMHQLNAAERLGVTLLGGYTAKRVLPYVENFAFLYKKFLHHHKSTKSGLKTINRSLEPREAQPV
jgi:radical SAM protein with 4Fe4S-binding SPASM domain